jgi:hypothetical protein
MQIGAKWIEILLMTIMLKKQLSNDKAKKTPFHSTLFGNQLN